MNSSNRTDAAAPSSDYRSKRRIRILATFGFLSIALIVITVVSAVQYSDRSCDGFARAPLGYDSQGSDRLS